jgi:hypothetical protein
MGDDIVASDRFAKAFEVPHHSKDRNIANHSYTTAIWTLRIARWLKRHGVRLSEVDSVRAALLHDMGMTVDEVFLSPSHEKAHTHPVEGARIAREEFDANETQLDAVLHHMWPVVPGRPHSPEGWTLVMADKCCSIGEVAHDLRARAARIRHLRTHYRAHHRDGRQGAHGGKHRDSRRNQKQKGNADE